VADGKIGEVRFIDVSARSTPLDQGVHVLELAHSYNGFAAPTSIFGQVSGAKNLTSRQPAPDIAEASINFANGVRGQLVCGAWAPIATKQESIYHHKRISVYGTRGFLQWTMWWWERLSDGHYEKGEHNYGVEDDQAQARLTEACFDWLEDEKKPHPTRIALNLVQFNAILGIYISALRATPVALPFDPPDGLCDAMKARLA
jgi:predicted dehydrogenase